MMCETYLQYQQNIYHIFIDIEKTVNKEWHAPL